MKRNEDVRRPAGTPCSAAYHHTIMNIAVLALQGAFAEHRQMLHRLGVESHEVRQLSDWEKPKDGLIIPGGESTTITRLLYREGLFEPIREAILKGLPVFGTCAGLIVLARHIEKEDDTESHAVDEEKEQEQKLLPDTTADDYPQLATMDITVRRNAYGRQLGSFHTIADIPEIGTRLPLTFIRAPFISRVHGNAKILATVDGHIVAAQEGCQLVTAFHPELTDDVRVHQYFINLIG